MKLRVLATTESLVFAVLDSVLFSVFTGAEVRVLHVEQGIAALLKEARAVGKGAMMVAHARTPLPTARSSMRRPPMRRRPTPCGTRRPAAGSKATPRSAEAAIAT